MSVPAAAPEPVRSRRWMAAMLGILLAATLLNYANRFAFTQNALPVQAALNVGEDGYGQVAAYFGLGFAAGGLLFGILADWISVRWLYPFVVIVWSIAGFASGWIDDLVGMSVARFLLGMFEAGHWPCALRTTQRLLRPDQRTFGNSVLQSGASLGAVLTPQLVLLLHSWDPGLWRWSFYLVGGLGIPWAIAWLWTVRESDVRRPVIQTDEESRGAGESRVLEEVPFYQVFLLRRWWVLLLAVICINTMWHYIRVWMPMMLEKDHGYGHGMVQNFTSLYYLATFFGSLASGWLTMHLVRRGMNVHRSRMAVFLGFGLLASLAIPAAFMPAGYPLLAMLLCVAFGSLGLFPVYYSLNQEISAKNQGKVGGSLGFSTWGMLYFVHLGVGWLVEHFPTIGDVASSPWGVRLGMSYWLVGPIADGDQWTRSYLMAAVGFGPLIAFLVLLCGWGRRSQSGKPPAPKSA